jgi:hypothetical protein
MENMMKLKTLALTVAISALMAVSTVGSLAATDKAAPQDGAARANLAATLAQYGTANHDASSLLAAAHIINSLKSNVGKQTATAGDGKPEAYDPLSLLKLAKTYAGDDKALASAIDVEMKNVSATQAVCYYSYYCNGWGYCWYAYRCY